jgi:phosphatidate cytidylyltransferase
VRARVATIAVGAPLVFVATWLGGGYLAGIVALICILALVELRRLVPQLSLAATAIAAVVVVGTTLIWDLRGLVGGWAAAAAAMLCSGNPRAILALVYIPLLLGHLILLRDGPHGAARAVGTVAVVWVADTAAFLAGSRWGRRKLAPRLSPGKSLEGLVAGLAAAVAVGAAGAYAAGLEPRTAALVALAVAAAGTAGDLFESWLKRRAAVKDSGDLLPGHGGVLDRFDSLFFATPTAYWLLRLHAL